MSSLRWHSTPHKRRHRGNATTAVPSHYFLGEFAMKLKSVISTALFSVIAVLTSSTQAASNADKAAETKAPAAEMLADKATAPKKDPMLEEKAAATKSTKPKTVMDMKKSDHNM
jgi:hypothetical protein